MFREGKVQKGEGVRKEQRANRRQWMNCEIGSIFSMNADGRRGDGGTASPHQYQRCQFLQGMKGDGVKPDHRSTVVCFGR